MIDSIPRHVGIIMDGNGRWAKLRGLPRVEGHKRGAERVKDIIRAAKEIGIRYITLYAFSLENWRRPEDEVFSLMNLLKKYLIYEIKELLLEGVGFRAIGDLTRLPEDIRLLLEKTEEMTREAEGPQVILALSYGGRDEIVRAAKRAIRLGLTEDTLDETTFENLLDTAAVPPVDLVIRTSGEKRLSNFLLWQTAYSELYFTDTLWPDFTKEEFIFAIQDYQRRERRFGALMP
ncbi:MAG: di-trans,poly-cis-decaprenylcistransferase [Nitrospirae bacterium]|nr:MAG: di-trans,poly-cis-decaprenylcistransferase [Nitrospirota bacterium]